MSVLGDARNSHGATDEGRVAHRLARNEALARVSRERKKQYVAELEQKVALLSQQLTELAGEPATLTPTPSVNQETALYSLSVEPYPRNRATWPTEGQHILAQFGTREQHSTSPYEPFVVVYQAYNDSIANYAVRHRRFDGCPAFQNSRMTWIKTNFLWMMYRSDWGSKRNQNRILAIWLRLEAFHRYLSQAVLSSFDNEVYGKREEYERAVKEAQADARDGSGYVRLQWDPDHGPRGTRAGGRRAVQIGLKGMQSFIDGTDILHIEDISAFVRSQSSIAADEESESKLLTPVERVHVPDSVELCQRIGLGHNGVVSRPPQHDNHARPSLATLAQLVLPEADDRRSKAKPERKAKAAAAAAAADHAENKSDDTKPIDDSDPPRQLRKAKQEALGRRSNPTSPKPPAMPTAALLALTPKSHSQCTFVSVFPTGDTNPLELPVREMGPAVAYYVHVLGFTLVSRTTATVVAYTASGSTTALSTLGTLSSAPTASSSEPSAPSLSSTSLASKSAQSLPNTTELFELTPHSTTVPVATLERNGVCIGLRQSQDEHPDAPHFQNPRSASVYFEVKHVRDLHEEYTKKGLEPSPLKLDEYGKRKFLVFFAKEPYGVCFCFGEGQS